MPLRSNYFQKVKQILAVLRHPTHLRTEYLFWQLRNHLRSLDSSRESTVKPPVFIKVGSNDGLTGDPTGATLLRSKSWTGILIEPLPHVCEIIRRNYPDASRFAVEQVAIGEAAEERDFFYVAVDDLGQLESIPFWMDQIGSLDRSHVSKHLPPHLDHAIHSLRVQVVPLNALITAHGVERISFLHIDAEGYDDTILFSLDLDSWEVDTILIEHHHLGKQRREAVRAHLVSAGFKVTNTGGDFIAFASKPHS